MTTTTSTDLRAFDFSGLELRVLTISGEPWFALSDINRALYGKTHGLAWVTERLSEDERTKCDRTTLGMAPGQKVVLVCESGLFKLIMRSDKPEARKFQDWVTRDVLPAIRKTGGYLLNEGVREKAQAVGRGCPSGRVHGHYIWGAAAPLPHCMGYANYPSQ